MDDLASTACAEPGRAPRLTPKRAVMLAGWVAAVLVLSACGGAPRATLNGSGSTFAKAFYEEAIAFFPETDVQVTYAGGGSGQGQQELADGVVTWAGTDATVKPEDLGRF